MRRVKKALLNLLSFALIPALMLALPFAVRAEDEPEEAPIILLALPVQDEPADLFPQDAVTQEAAPGKKEALQAEPLPREPRTFDFWSIIPLLTFRYNSGENYFYNTKYSPQWLFGFNKLYDMLSFIAGCFYDTLRFQFKYGGRDWMVQVWKGAYGYGLFTGGELGIYSKNEGFPLEHYQGAGMGDWIGMEFSIYHHEDKLFTRPMEDTWWVTGFKPYILSDLTRKYCIMEAALRFPSEEMAAQFAQAVAGKGFALVETEDMILDGSYNTERYAISGDTVRFLWREKTEGYF